MSTTSCASGASGPSGDMYFAGLLDAQLAVHATKSKTDERNVRVTLECDDERVLREIRSRFTPARETITRRPGKKDTCVAIVSPDDTRRILEFAAKNCVLRGELAKTAIQYLDGHADDSALSKASARTVTEDDLPTDMPVEWISGYFDVRGTIVAPSTTADENAKPVADAEKKRRTNNRRRRGTVKLVLPKSEKAILPKIQSIIKAGKVKRSSPCRLVFESQEHLDTFMEVISPFVRAKRRDLHVCA